LLNIIWESFYTVYNHDQVSQRRLSKWHANEVEWSSNNQMEYACVEMELEKSLRNINIYGNNCYYSLIEDQAGSE